MNTTNEKKFISKEIVHKAIKCEISFDEIEKIWSSGNIEPDDYFNLDAYINAIHKFMKNYVEEHNHINWALVCMKSLYADDFKGVPALSKIYNEVANNFDGYAFLGYDKGGKASFCREMIAELKYYNHRIENAKHRKRARFYNDNKTEIFISFSHTNLETNVYYNICVADHQNKCFKIGYVVNPDFLEEVNYTFTPYYKDFDDFIYRFSNYYQDESIDFSKYIGTVK